MADQLELKIRDMAASANPTDEQIAMVMSEWEQVFAALGITDERGKMEEFDGVMRARVQAGIWEGTPSGQTLFGYPIIYSDKLPVGEITFGRADENWARRYFGLPPKES
jgi:hypothetical protein